MIALLKSDLYRMIKSAGFYAILIVEALGLAFLLSSNHVPDQDGSAYGVSINMFVMGANWIFMIAFSFWLSYIVGNNFHSRVVIQKFTSGYSRDKIFFAQFLAASVVCLGMYLLFYLLCIISCACATGHYYFESGIRFDDNSLFPQFAELVEYAAAGIPSVLALCALIVCIQMNVQNRTAANILTMVLPYLVIALEVVAHELPTRIESGSEAVVKGMQIFAFVLHLLSLFFLPAPYFTPYDLPNIVRTTWSTIWEPVLCAGAALILLALCLGLGIRAFRNKNLS